MDEKNVEGAANEMRGETRDAAEGISGQAQQTYGAAVDDLKDFTSSQPLAALLTALGIGVVLGFVLGRR